MKWPCTDPADQDVDPAEGLQRGVDNLADLGLVGDIGGDPDGLGSQRLHFPDGVGKLLPGPDAETLVVVSGVVSLEIGHDEPGAPHRQRLGDGPTLAVGPGRPGDDGDSKDSKDSTPR